MQKILAFIFFLSLGYSQIPKNIYQKVLQNPDSATIILKQEGYRLAQCYEEKCSDCIKITDSLYCFSGKRFIVKRITISEDGFLVKSVKTNIPFSNFYLEIISRKLLEDYAKEGFIKAKLLLTNVKYEEENRKIKVILFFNLKKGAKYFVHSIDVENEKYKFLISHITKLEEGKKFDFPGLINSSDLLSKSGYFEVKKEPVFWSYDDSTIGIRFFVKNIAKNAGDGLVALIPPTKAGEKMQFTGNLRLMLKNNLQLGEEFSLTYNKLLSSSQNLQIAASLPYIHKFPVGAFVKFLLYKQDTTFFRRSSELGFIWHISTNNSIIFSRKTVNSSVLSKVFFKETLPKNIDNKTSLFGLTLMINSLNNNTLPTKGYYIKNSLFYGSKKVLRSPLADSLDYSQFPNKQQVKELEFTGKYFLPLTLRHNLMFKTNIYLLLQDFYFENDLHFVGGNGSLRGFIQNEFLADRYFIQTLEYRFFLEAESYIGTFIDYGYLEYSASRERSHNNLVGLGLTFSTITKIGRIDLSYAFAKYPNESINFNKGRVHIGFSF